MQEAHEFLTGPRSEDQCVLLRYQRRWVYDRSRTKIAAKSRQVGITWATAYEAVEVASLRAADGGMDVYFMSMSKDDAAQFIRDCADWVRKLSPLITGLVDASDIEELGTDWHALDDSKLLTYRISFPSGFSIFAMPSRPARLRGKRGYAICDEAAQQDLAAWRKAAVGLFVWGGRVAYISTYFGSDNDFTRMVEDARGAGAVALHEITIYDALADGIYRRICRKLGRPWNPEAEAEWIRFLREDAGEDFPEEFECIPSSGGGTMFPRAMVQRCATLGEDQCTVIEIRGDARPQLWVDGKAIDTPSGSWSPDDPKAVEPDVQMAAVRRWCTQHIGPALARINALGLPVIAASDYARKNHISATVFGARTRAGRRKLGLVLEFEKVAWALQDAIHDYCFDRIEIEAGRGDAQGAGSNSAENAQRRTGGKFRPVTSTADKNAARFGALEKAIQAGRYEFPLHHEALVGDLGSVKRSGGRIKTAERVTRDGRKQIRHGDLAHALALFEEAAAEGDTPPEPERPRRRRGRARLRMIKP